MDSRVHESILYFWKRWVQSELCGPSLAPLPAPPRVMGLGDLRLWSQYPLKTGTGQLNGSRHWREVECLAKNFHIFSVRMVYAGALLLRINQQRSCLGKGFPKTVWAIHFECDYWPVNNNRLTRITGENSIWNVNHLCQLISKTRNLALILEIVSTWSPDETPIRGKAVKTKHLFWILPSKVC